MNVMFLKGSFDKSFLDLYGSSLICFPAIQYTCRLVRLGSKLDRNVHKASYMVFCSTVIRSLGCFSPTYSTLPRVQSLLFH